jgi:pilus assembly protein CpaF
MTYPDIEAEIGEAVDYVVHVEREPQGRVIREVLRVVGYDRRAQRFETDYVFPTENQPLKEPIAC